MTLGSPLQVPSDQPLVDRHDALLVDLDGVVYVGPHPVPHAVDSLGLAARHGLSIAYVTNNASRPPREVADHLRELGLALAEADVVTSAQAGARLVADRVPSGSAVLAVGGPGVSAALLERGFQVVASADDEPVAVLQGYGPDVRWRDLAEAAYAVQRGAIHVATNRDLTIPTPGGRAPGNGSLVAAVVTATGVEPQSAGKPDSALMLESIERVGSKTPLTVGDRLDTDIEAACRLGLPSLLVFTGVSGVPELLAAPAHARPTWVSADLRGLLMGHPAVIVEGDQATCANARVTLGDDGVLVIERPSPDPLDDVRAGAVLVWRAIDSGQQVDLVGSAKALAELSTR